MNSLLEIKQFFEVPDRPVVMTEFKEFWDSCTDEEKQEFREAELLKD